MAKLDGRVKQLLGDRRHWCAATLAKNAEGESCSPYDRKAVKFCLVGAVWNRYGVLEGEAVGDEMKRAKVYQEWLLEKSIATPDGLATFADECGYNQVMRLLNEVNA